MTFIAISPLALTGTFPFTFKLTGRSSSIHLRLRICLWIQQLLQACWVLSGIGQRYVSSRVFEFVVCFFTFLVIFVWLFLAFPWTFFPSSSPSRKDIISNDYLYLTRLIHCILCYFIDNETGEGKREEMYITVRLSSFVLSFKFFEITFFIAVLHLQPMQLRQLQHLLLRNKNL